MESKFFLQSKTIIGAILVVAPMLAPLLGITFTEEDAGVIRANLDQILSALGVLMVVWGRVATDGSPLRLSPISPTKPDDTVLSPWFVSVLAMALFLTGCVLPTSKQLEDKTPVELARITYDSVQPSLQIYYALPTCTDEYKGLCSKPDVVAKIKEAETVFLAALTYAESVAPDATDEALDEAAIAAQNALRQLITIYAIQAITKA
jgi:uncharacterized membrane protein